MPSDSHVKRNAVPVPKHVREYWNATVPRGSMDAGVRLFETTSIVFFVPVPIVTVAETDEFKSVNSVRAIDMRLSDD